MTTFKLDENNDFIVGNDILLCDGAEAILQVVKNVCLTFFSEMVLHSDQGVPYNEYIFEKENYAIIVKALKLAVERVEGVISVDYLVFSSMDNIANYEMKINTIYGALNV